VITRLLIIANVIAFAWEMRVAGFGVLTAGLPEHSRVDDFILAPNPVIQFHEYYRMLTAGFLHANGIHIAVNMVSLASLGSFVEHELGSTRYAMVYFFSLLASSLAVVLFAAPYAGTLGASGAIFGVFGALFAIGLKYGPPGMQLIRANLGILAFNLIFTFAVPYISKQAHVGGLIAGFLITLLIFWPRRPVQPVVIDAQTGVPLESQIEP